VQNNLYYSEKLSLKNQILLNVVFEIKKMYFIFHFNINYQILKTQAILNSFLKMYRRCLYVYILRE